MWVTYIHDHGKLKDTPHGPARDRHGGLDVGHILDAAGDGADGTAHGLELAEQAGSLGGLAGATGEDGHVTGTLGGQPDGEEASEALGAADEKVRGIWVEGHRANVARALCEGGWQVVWDLDNNFADVAAILQEPQGRLGFPCGEVRDRVWEAEAAVVEQSKVVIQKSVETS